MNSTGQNEEANHNRPLEDVIESIIDLGSKQEKVSVADIQEKVGQRSFGPFLFIPAIFEISPLGGIPGVPTLLGIIVALTAGQMLFGRRHFWLPEFISRRSVKGKRIGPAMQKIRPAVRIVDKALRPRLQWITRSPGSRLVAGLCVLCAISVPPLEIIPFASSGPFAAIAIIGLGLMAHDGIFVWLGIIVALATLFLLNFAF